MALQQKKDVPERQADLKFIVAVFDGCIESEWAVGNILESGLVRENIEMFYAHRLTTRNRSHGSRSGNLRMTLEYLEDLMGLDVSVSKEYEGHWQADRHILLVNVYGESEARGIAADLIALRPQAGRILRYGHTADLLTQVN